MPVIARVDSRSVDAGMQIILELSFNDANQMPTLL